MSLFREVDVSSSLEQLFVKEKIIKVNNDMDSIFHVSKVKKIAQFVLDCLTMNNIKYSTIQNHRVKTLFRLLFRYTLLTKQKFRKYE